MVIRAKGRKEKRSEVGWKITKTRRTRMAERTWFDQRSYEQPGIADARVSRKTSLNPVRVVSHPTLETSSNVRQRLGKRLREWWFGKVWNS